MNSNTDKVCIDLLVILGGREVEYRNSALRYADSSHLHASETMKAMADGIHLALKEIESYQKSL